MTDPVQESFCEVFFTSRSTDGVVIDIVTKFRDLPTAPDPPQQPPQPPEPPKENSNKLKADDKNKKPFSAYFRKWVGLFRHGLSEHKQNVNKSEQNVGATLRFSKPIKISPYSIIGGGYSDNFALAKLKIFDIQAANPLLPVEISGFSGNCLEVSYFRKQVQLSDSSSIKNSLGLDDLALVARIFLLIKVSKLKEGMRESLDELAKELEKASTEKKNSEANEQGSVGPKSIKKILISFFEALFPSIEHCLSRLVKKASGNSIFQIFMRVTGVLVIVDLLFHLLAPSRPHIFESQITILIILLIFLTTCFVLLALNFKDKEDRAQNEICEKTNSELGEILSELTQNNANVASLNIFPKPTGQAPEMVLRHFDQVLHIKEAVTGLEKVILARQRDVVAQISHVKEHQERARRAATAAAGGIFIGFFTFEVGERIFKFMHLIHGQDDRSMFFWLTTEAGPFANPDLVNARKGVPPEVKKAFCDSKGLKDCKTVEQPFDSMLIKEHFMKQYQQSEMHAYGVLLAITLVVSLIAAAIGWRKPAEEQAGGHGGHH